MKPIVGLMLGAMALQSCFDDPQSGRGSAGETTNGLWLEGKVERSAGLPAARAVVELLAPETTSVLSRDTADADGRYALALPRAGRYVVRAALDTAGIVQWVTVGNVGRNLSSMALAGPARLRGKLLDCPADPAKLRLYLPGLAREVPVGADSMWQVANVPAGWHLVQVLDAAGANLGELVASTWAPDPKGQAQPTNPPNLVPVSGRVSTILDDFEADEGQGRLVKLLDGAWWGRWNDTSANYDSARTWAGTPGLSTSVGAWRGRSLHASMRVGAAIEGHPELVRTAGLQLKIGGREDLDPASVWYSLERIDSVVFWAKGSGRIEFVLRSRDRLDPTRTGTLRAVVDLSSEWTRIALPSGGFSSPEGLAWSRSQAKELWWTTRQDAELWLDQIEFTGIRASDLLRQSRP